MEKHVINYMDYCNLYQEAEKLRLIAVGEEYCKPSHFNGPKIREQYLFHFVVSGEGIFRIRDKTYQVKANQAFLIPDSSIVYYEADKNNPWHYCWFTIQGKAAQSFFEDLSLSLESPVYTARGNNEIYACFKELLNSAKHNPNNPYQIISALYRCLQELYTANIHTRENKKISPQDKYVQAAELYIESHYHYEDLRIDDIAQHIGVHRSYLTKLFKKHHGVSPQQYLISIRMQKAKALLSSTDSPVGIIAYSVGYTDLFIFSKMYKKHFGVSPKNDRN